MGKVESNKLQKRTALLNAAYELFTAKGVNQTSIAEISEKAGIAKGTFYLYFKDKYDIRNKLISHVADRLFMDASSFLKRYCADQGTEMIFEDKIIFIADYVINALNSNKSLLTFINKNLSWGIFKEALTNVSDDEINFRDVYYEMLESSSAKFSDPEIMLFMITELISSTCHSSILYGEPANIEIVKPYIFKTIRSVIASYQVSAEEHKNKA